MLLRAVHMAFLAALLWVGAGLGSIAHAQDEAPASRDPEGMALIAALQAMRLPEDTMPTQPAQRLLLLRDQRAVNPYYENGPTKWRAYCARQAADCVVVAEAISVPLTPALWQSLAEVNTRINARILYTPDPQNGQGPDKWVRPDVAGEVLATGDCEDYVLAKRHALMARGLPAGALRFTLVARGQSKHADHAVLVVATDFGDFVLDNVVDGIRPVEATSYRYVSMHLAHPANPHRFRHTLPRPQPIALSGKGAETDGGA